MAPNQTDPSYQTHLNSLATQSGRDSVVTALRYVLQLAESGSEPPPAPDGTLGLEAAMIPSAAERFIEQGRALGEARGREIGECVGRSSTILRQLELRFGPVPVRVRYAISNAPKEVLSDMAERVITASRLEDVLAG